MKTAFSCTLNAIIRGSLCSGIDQFPTLFSLFFFFLLNLSQGNNLFLFFLFFISFFFFFYSPINSGGGGGGGMAPLCPPLSYASVYILISVTNSLPGDLTICFSTRNICKKQSTIQRKERDFDNQWNMPSAAHDV